MLAPAAASGVLNSPRPRAAADVFFVCDDEAQKQPNGNYGYHTQQNHKSILNAVDANQWPMVDALVHGRRQIPSPIQATISDTVFTM